MGELSPSARKAFKTIAELPSLLHYEQILSKTPFDIKIWLQYLDDIDDLLLESKNAADKHQLLVEVRGFVGRRSVAVLPGSYKLWKNHWEFLLQHWQNHDSYHHVIQAFESALQTLHKFPRTWIKYLTFVQSLPDRVIYINDSWLTKKTYVRRLANRALQALSISQHDEKVWPVILECLQEEKDGLPCEKMLAVETKDRLLSRYVMLQPSYRPSLCQFYEDHEKYGEAAQIYRQLLQQQTNRDSADYFSWWKALVDLCTQHPLQVENAGITWEAMIRSAALESTSAAENGSFTSSKVLQEMQGLLWSKLADSWIRRGAFDMARSVYEEALEKVSRVRDFAVLFDAYIQFEESLLEAAYEKMGDSDEQDQQVEHIDEEDWDILCGEGHQGLSMTHMEFAFARAEHLTSRRPLMLNRVMLRQNPNNVGDWLERSRLHLKQNEPEMSSSALEEALQTIQPTKAANGNLSQVVLELVKIYEVSLNSVDRARLFLDRVCTTNSCNFRNNDDLAECVAAWTELELRQENWDKALSIVRRAVAPVSNHNQRATGNKRLNLTRSLRLWDMLLDLEESLGTVQSTKDAYYRALETKVITPLQVLNFCSFLKEQTYFEESFAVYERGLELFAFPHAGAKLIWKAYIENFTERYKGKNIERTRDLFERCIESCPPEESSEFFMLAGDFEEKYGLMKRALSVYSSMAKKVPQGEKHLTYNLLIAKTTRYTGMTATRAIYQEAIETLEDDQASQMCLAFAKMEISLQEIERSRAIYVYGSQMADPRRNPEYWKQWNAFEVAHGNEETFREMLRVRRSVEAAFSTVNYNAAEMSTGNKIKNLSNEEAFDMIAKREGVEYELNEPRSGGFVPSSKRTAKVADLEEVEDRVAKLRKVTGSSSSQGNKDLEVQDDEIDIDDDDDDDEQEQGVEKNAISSIKDVTTKALPKGIFGGLAERD